MEKYSQGDSAVCNETEDHDISDNLVDFKDTDCTQSLSQLENEIRDQMSSNPFQVKDSLLGLNEQMQQKFKDFEAEILKVQSDIKEQTSQVALSQLWGSAPGPMQENIICKILILWKGNSCKIQITLAVM